MMNLFRILLFFSLSTPPFCFFYIIARYFLFVNINLLLVVKIAKNAEYGQKSTNGCFGPRKQKNFYFFQKKVLDL